MSDSIPSPFDLRKYLEKHHLRADQMLNLASPALNKGLPTVRHWEWLNVLLTRAFSPDTKSGVGIRAKDENTLANTISPLIVRPKYIEYLEREQLLNQSSHLLKRLQSTTTFDELVKNQLPAKRNLHHQFHQHSTSPELLTRNVFLGVAMHEKFEKLYSEVLIQMQALSDQLRRYQGTLQALPQDSSEISIATAMEFVAKPEPWINGEYSQNMANLQTVLRMRDLLQRATVFYSASLPTIDPTTPATIITPQASEPTINAAPPPGRATTRLNQDLSLAYELEAEINACVQYLTQTAENPDQGSAIRVIRLSSGNMILTSWEAAAFAPLPNIPEWKLGFLARETRKLLQRSIALLAVIEQKRPKPTESQKLTLARKQVCEYYLEQISELLNAYDRFLQRSATSPEDLEILSNLRMTRRKLAIAQTQLRQVLGAY